MSGLADELTKLLESYIPEDISKLNIKELEHADQIALQLIRSLMAFYSLDPKTRDSDEDALWYMAAAISVARTSEWCPDGSDKQEEAIVNILFNMSQRIDDSRFSRHKGRR